ncbi:MAG: hypothetical protein HQL01_04490 [Nitrospirae bacterium]|nr:hypothetical protein [Nitrospirota bacterium]
MKYLLLVVAALTMITGYAHADCSLPCGVEELITCAAQNNNMSAEDFYNNKLFLKANLDGFCVSPPAGSQDYQLQKDFYKSYCTNAGSYYSYQNFITASKSKPFTDFGCAANTTKELRYKELANFLATIAQETTSASAKHTNDGLYWRYENGWLMGDNTSYITPYYPENNWVVATQNNTSPLLTYTGALWYSVSGGANVYNLKTSPMQISWGQVTPPSGYSQATLNSLIEPAYWIGMGATQLTKDSMMEFFGWYYQNLATGYPIDAADYKAFVTTYIQDGVLGFNGAFWYWIYRINGSGYRTIHQVVTDQNKLVCQDIAAVSRMVNGGCNDYNPGRVDYYQYFLGLFNVTLTPVSGTYNVLINNVPTPTQLNSMACDSNIQAYCQVQ